MNLNSIVFPAPKCSYSSEKLFKDLVYIPKPGNTKNSASYIENTPTSSGGSNREYIPCLYLPFELQSKLCICFHGNAEDLGVAYDIFCEIRDSLKVSVLAVEYPGYGLNITAMGTDNLLNDSLFVFDFIVQKFNIKETDIMLIGRSIGSSPACYIASKRPNICSLILLSPFKSLQSVAKDMVGSLLSYLLAERFENIQLIKQIRCPVCIIHGQKDHFVPFHHSQELNDQCIKSTFCKLYLPPSMTHNDFDFQVDFINPVLEFFKEINMNTLKLNKLYNGESILNFSEKYYFPSTAIVNYEKTFIKSSIIWQIVEARKKKEISQVVKKIKQSSKQLKSQMLNTMNSQTDKIDESESEKINQLFSDQNSLKKPKNEPLQEVSETGGSGSTKNQVNHFNSSPFNLELPDLEDNDYDTNQVVQNRQKLVERQTFNKNQMLNQSPFLMNQTTTGQTMSSKQQDSQGNNERYLDSQYIKNQRELLLREREAEIRKREQELGNTEKIIKQNYNDFQQKIQKLTTKLEGRKTLHASDSDINSNHAYTSKASTYRETLKKGRIQENYKIVTLPRMQPVLKQIILVSQIESVFQGHSQQIAKSQSLLQLKKQSTSDQMKGAQQKQANSIKTLKTGQKSSSSSDDEEERKYPIQNKFSLNKKSSRKVQSKKSQASNNSIDESDEGVDSRKNNNTLRSYSKNIAGNKPIQSRPKRILNSMIQRQKTQFDDIPEIDDDLQIVHKKPPKDIQKATTMHSIQEKNKGIIPFSKQASISSSGGSSMDSSNVKRQNSNQYARNEIKRSMSPTKRIKEKILTKQIIQQTEQKTAIKSNRSSPRAKQNTSLLMNTDTKAKNYHNQQHSSLKQSKPHTSKNQVLDQDVPETSMQPHTGKKSSRQNQSAQQKQQDLRDYYQSQSEIENQKLKKLNKKLNDNYEKHQNGQYQVKETENFINIKF